MKILIVDDSKLVRLMLAKRVRSLEFGEVIEAGNGPDALALIDGVDIVLTDMEMPGMNGRELALAIRARPGTDQIAILLISAHEIDEASAVELREAGIDGFVEKGLGAEPLRERILGLLRLRRSEP